MILHELKYLITFCVNLYLSVRLNLKLQVSDGYQGYNKYSNKMHVQEEIQIKSTREEENSPYEKQQSLCK